jgi:hypothetical protein
MADQTVLNPGTGGDTIRTIDRTSDSTPITAKTQVMQIDVGGESNENLLIGVAKNTQPSPELYVPVLDSKDSGRTYVTFYIDAIAGVTTEALATFTANVGGTTSSGTTYTVPTGKTLRIQSMTATVEDNTTTTTSVSYGRFRLRCSTGTVASTSPILVNLAIPALLGSQGLGFGQSETMAIPDGLEIPAGSQLGISQTASVTTSLISVNVVAFYY